MTTVEQKGYMYQALVFMQTASGEMSWANNCVEDIEVVPKELKVEMVQVCKTIGNLVERLRDIKKEAE